MRDAPCDLLLVPRPLESPDVLRRVVFALEPGEDVEPFLRNSLKLLRPEHVTIAVTKTPFAAAIAASRGEEPRDVDAWLEELGGVAFRCRPGNRDANCNFEHRLSLMRRHRGPPGGSAGRESSAGRAGGHASPSHGLVVSGYPHALARGEGSRKESKVNQNQEFLCLGEPVALLKDPESVGFHA